MHFYPPRDRRNVALMVTSTRQAGAGPPSGAAARSAGWPVRSGPLPPLADCFSLRPETGLDTAYSFAPGSAVVLTHPAPPEGPSGRAAVGGTGKTQLAAAIALSAWRSGGVDLMAWVPAAGRDAVLTGYAQALIAAGLPGARATADAAAASFLGWLAKTGRPWLVVLDDVTDAGDLDGLWPAGAAGVVLVTTRLPAKALQGRDLKVLEVGTFSPREAVSYLTARLSEPGMRAGALDLATSLGCLPLGLTQASAVVAEGGADCRRYLAQFAGRARQMRAAQPGRQIGAVEVTWSLSLEVAEALSPPGTAGCALALLALLDPAGVPGAVLTSGAACRYICGRDDSGTQADETRVRRVLDSLSRAGLVTIDPASPSRTVQMHDLVQAAIRQAMTAAGFEQATAAAASALLQAWPPDGTEPFVAQALRDCTASLHRAAGDLMWAPQAHQVLLRAGQSLSSAGLTSLAVPFWRQLADGGRRVLGEAHPATLIARDGLAAAYLAAGRIPEAIAEHKQSLADRVQALGPDHPETLAACGTLARTCLDAGRAADAIPLYERALAGWERRSGAGHPETAAARGGLAAAYLSAGRLPDAIALLQRLYRDRAAALGPGHPETLAACGDLAAALHSGGRLKDAIPLYERALAGWERAEGPAHPDTMAVRASLAYAYRSAGRMKHALPVYERTLADRERVLGPDHPDTLASMANLASAYHTAHKLKQAVPLYEETLSRHERSNGPDHPGTLAARGNLASAYHSAGRLPHAIPLYEQNLRDYERVLGADHTSTLTARANLASAYCAVGRNPEAITLFERTLADCERLLPAGHPMTQTIRENLQATR
jgi:tetratricopeptide (TPR) repeat protein